MPPELKEYTEKEIIGLIAKGKKDDAFNIILEQYKQRLYWHIRKIVISHEDTDDVLQNTFIKVWKNIGGFRAESRLYTWLYRIATNESISFLKKKKLRTFIPLIQNEYDLSETIESDPYFNGNETQKKLQKALLMLPEKQRIVFNMKYFDDMKYEEIAEILNTSVGALKASYHHAVKKIEKYLIDI
jgi:RNA polymerase sigma-70 factor (ECF subfamily)